MAVPSPRDSRTVGAINATPSVVNGYVYFGTGNTQFSNSRREADFPKSTAGILYSFGLPGRDAIDRMGDGDE